MGTTNSKLSKPPYMTNKADTNHKNANTNWIDLQQFPIKYATAHLSIPLMITDNQFAVATITYNYSNYISNRFTDNQFAVPTVTQYPDDKYNKVTDSQSGIYEYNINQNKWNKLAKYPSTVSISDPPLTAFNTQTNIFYLFCEGKGNVHFVIQFDMINHKWNMYPTLIVNLQTISIINNELYGINILFQHFIWDTKQKEFKKVNDMLFGKYSWYEYQIIYLKSKQMILVFGNNDKDDDFDLIYRFSIKYNKILPNVKIPKLHTLSAVQSRNDKYVVLFDWSIDERNVVVLIFDVENETLIQNEITCPFALYPEQNVVKMIMVNEYTKQQSVLLICGYIRNSCIPLPSNDILNLIMIMHNPEYIHIMTDDGHWKICFEHVVRK